MESKIENQLKEKKAFKNATVSHVENTHTLVVAATGTYITIDEFKSIFNYIGELVKSHKITKLVFDKRKLNVFHQPSMEWYFVEWKEKMFDLGLKTHRKILPEDQVFRQSVKIGRQQIAEKYPNGKFNEMDIQYFENLDDAIEK
ncbi:hypothetical protein [Fulvivirga lutea]|uniref:hypothetical protein n=1 Tax=Fulvivirga lutea TaxID=2810512 RepID=UPI001F291B0C|nr:hypothetical protein [Fulvivirga lutea]